MVTPTETDRPQPAAQSVRPLEVLHWRCPRIHRLHVLDPNNRRKLMKPTEDARNENLIDHFDVEVRR